MNIAFDISPLITASGIIGDKSGVYRYILGLISSLQKYLEEKEPKRKIILFTFNYNLLTNILNPDILYLSSKKNVVFINNYLKILPESKVETFIEKLTINFPIIKLILKIINNFFYIKNIYKNIRVNSYIKTYLKYLNKEFKKNNVKIIFHSETGFYFLKGYKNVMTIYDLTPKLFPQFHRSETIDLFNRKIKFARNFADGIICISQSTKNDLLKYYPSFMNKKITVIYPGYNKMINNNISINNLFENIKLFLKKNNLNLIKKKYLLYYGTFEPRKNIIYLVKSFIELKEKNLIPNYFKLVLIGGEGWGNIKKIIQNYILENFPIKNKSNIIILNYLSDNYLYSLIKNAYAVVYPSLYEGFGLPVLESMIIGTPVICSNNSSIPEVGQDAVIYFDPINYFDLKEKIQKLVNNPKLALELSKKGPLRAKIFNWEKIIKKLNNFCHQILNQS